MYLCKNVDVSAVFFLDIFKSDFGELWITINNINSFIFEVIVIKSKQKRQKEDGGFLWLNI